MSETLAGKIAKVSAELGGWTADKKNKEQGYDYISADAVLTKAGAALAKQGIAIFPAAACVETKVTERQGRTPRIDATVQFNMIVTDGEKELLCTWVGAGSDYATPDKAVYKAITSGHKYFLMKLLNVGVGNEDGEHEIGEADKASANEAETENKDNSPVTAQAWEEWGKLVKQAQALNVPFDEVKRKDVTQGKLRKLYGELNGFVKQARAQAEAV